MSHLLKIPARYVRIDDVGLGDLEAANKKRLDEIHTSKDVLKKLLKQKVMFQKEHQEARAARDEYYLVKKRPSVVPALQVHQLLQDCLVAPGKKNMTTTIDDNNRSLLVKRPEDDSKVFSALLAKLPSVYDWGIRKRLGYTIGRDDLDLLRVYGIEI